MKYEFEPKGVCSRKITLEIVDGKIEELSFVGGCSGNLQGIAALCKGMKPEEVIERVRGIRCGFKPTSCPDQLAHALEEVMDYASA